MEDFIRTGAGQIINPDYVKRVGRVSENLLGKSMEYKVTRKTVALICVLTKWNLLVMHSDKDNLEIIKDILDVCENVKDEINAKDGE